jgi:outer membrane protein OmpA-like peptidoglycan-associated protein
MRKYRILLLSLFVVIGMKAQRTRADWIRFGDEAFDKKDFPSAIDYYTHALKDTGATGEHVIIKPYEVMLHNPALKDPKKKGGIDSTKKEQKEAPVKDYVNHKLAIAFMLNYDYDHAVKVFERTARQPEYFPHDEYWYGISLMKIKQYNKAMEQFEDFMLHPISDSLRSLANHQLTSCFYALDSNNVHKQLIVRKADSVLNIGTANFAPMYYGSPTKLIITSARKENIVNDIKREDPAYLCDLYVLEKKDTSWMPGKNFGKPVNSNVHEGAGVATADDNVYFTRWNDNNRNEAFIYMAKYVNGKFLEPIKLNGNVNMPGYRNIQPFVTFDGSTLYFASNRPGGRGGMDIYVSKLDENGYASPARNLGEIINTAGDEVSPFYHMVASTLFFASDGHAGLGGLDILKSSFNNDDSTFTKPKNLGVPINSSQDDAYMIMDRLQQTGFFASDREPCEAGHCYDIYEYRNEPIVFDLSGHVYDQETNEPIASALVTLKDVHGDLEPQYFITDENGFYSTPLRDNMEYFVKGQKNKYFGGAANIATKGLTESKHFVQDFYLGKIPAGDIVIEGIEYDFDKATLRPKSMEILDKLYDLLQLNENITVEINSHTDARGSDKYNEKLSQQRAQSCVDYLLSKGIAMTRLTAKGYGEYKPLIAEADIMKMPSKEEQEAAHQKNRRTAFRVTKEGAIIASPNQ